MWRHLLNELLYILALCQLYRIWLCTGLALYKNILSPASRWKYIFVQGPVPIYLIWLYTGLALCIAGERIFLDRASPVAIYSCWLCTGLALCIASFFFLIGCTYYPVVCLSCLSVTLVYCGQTVWRIKMNLGRNRFAKLVSDSFPKPVSDSADKSITLGSLCSTGRQGRCDKVFL